MKVSLSNIEAQRMMMTLRNIDNSDSVSLSGMVRLDIARNINRLMPQVSDFERAINQLRRGVQHGEVHLAANNELAEKLDEISQAAIKFNLIDLDPAALRLDDNKRITGDMIASLAPILKDFDSLADGDAKEDGQ